MANQKKFRTVAKLLMQQSMQHLQRSRRPLQSLNASSIQESFFMLYAWLVVKHRKPTLWSFLLELISFDRRLIAFPWMMEL
jgi:hypothetical protein